LSSAFPYIGSDLAGGLTLVFNFFWEKAGEWPTKKKAMSSPKTKIGRRQECHFCILGVG